MRARGKLGTGPGMKEGPRKKQCPAAPVLGEMVAAPTAPGGPPELRPTAQRDERSCHNNSPSGDGSYLLVVVAETLEKPQELYLQSDVLKHTCILDVKTILTMFPKKTEHSAQSLGVSLGSSEPLSSCTTRTFLEPETLC